MTTRRGGFTLVELLVVMVIMVILGALLFPAAMSMKSKANFNRWQGYSSKLRADTDLMLYYTFQEGKDTKTENLATNAADRENTWGEIYNATWVGGVTGGTTTRWSGKPALSFKLADSARVSAPSFVWPGTGTGTDPRPVSVEFWFKGAYSGSNMGLFYVGNDTPSAYSNRQFSCNIVSSSSTAFDYTDPSGTGGSASATPDSSTFSTQWNHYVFTSEGTTGNPKTYINGKLSGTGSANTAGSTATRKYLTLGGWVSATSSGIPSTWDHYLTGFIDEFAIYKRALTETEVADHYKQGKP